MTLVDRIIKAGITSVSFNDAQSSSRFASSPQVQRRIANFVVAHAQGCTAKGDGLGCRCVGNGGASILKLRQT